MQVNTKISSSEHLEKPIMNLIFFEISEKEIITHLTYTVCLSVYKLLPDPEIFKITGKTSKLFSSTYMHF